ncbi:YdcF family protein [Tissierella praeacuta]|uniref:YdcF family protein n=1 Tax=Tissierella praeacuta TaxID=43131 RepID=UPI003DA40CAC
MNNNIYLLLRIIFFAFFLLWFILHLTDRRRVFNGLAFFISLGSFLALLILIGFTNEIRILNIIAGMIIIGVIILLPILYIIGSIILFTTGKTVIKKEGFSLSHGLSILFGIGIISSSIILPIFINRIKSKILIGLMGFFITVFSYFVLGFIIFLTSSLIYNLWYEKRNKDYLIVLGAGLIGDRVTPLLASRIDKAIEFYNSQKEKGVKPPKIIMSGGQGADEVVSEAFAMKSYALEMNIPEEDILMEDKSTNTKENLKFSTNLIKNDSLKNNPKVLLFTTNYHVLRAGILAKSMGFNYNGLGSKTKFYYYVSAIIREYIAIIYLNLNKNILFAIFIGVFYFLSFVNWN